MISLHKSRKREGYWGLRYGLLQDVQCTVEARKLEYHYPHALKVE